MIVASGTASGTQKNETELPAVALTLDGDLVKVGMAEPRKTKKSQDDLIYTTSSRPAWILHKTIVKMSLKDLALFLSSVWL